MPEVTALPKPAASASPYTRSNPFPGKMVVNRRLSGPESEKDTRHFEIDLTGWGLSFEVGDSLAVYPTNDPELVDEIIRAIGVKGDEIVPAARGRQHADHHGGTGNWGCAFPRLFAGAKSSRSKGKELALLRIPA